jgi:predicted GIY-YIG superfamily endonuclease
MTNFCYVLWNDAQTHTYAGYTVNPLRRLRQHNGELVGGARATSRQKAAWSFLILIKCDAWTKKQALSFEWYLKNHRGWSSAFANPIDRRFDLLKRALAHEKFCGLTFDVWIDPAIPDIDLPCNAVLCADRQQLLQENIA